MLSPHEQQLWLDLQRETLSRVHASWLPSIPPPLVAVARQRAIGRRWLATPLAAASPILFGRPTLSDARSAARLVRASWLLPLLQASLDCALDLGSIVFGPTVRRIVKRSAVVKLRAVLGERYLQILRAQAGPAEGDPAEPLNDEDHLIERLTRCGVAELIAYADRLHPAWGEGFKLTFEREWFRGKPASPPQLLPDIVEAALRSRAQPAPAAGAPPAAAPPAAPA